MGANLVPIPLVYSALFISTIGVFGNLTICLITLKYKSLHSRCCLLIGLLAFFDLIVCIHLVQLRVMMVLEVYYLPNSTCFYISAYGIFAMNMQSAMGLFIGVDRFLNVSFPIKYPSIPLQFYTAAFILCLIFSAGSTLYGYFLASDKVIVSVCIPITALNGNSNTFWLWANFLIAVSVVFVYGFAYVRCQYFRGIGRHTRTMASIDRILKSLIVIVALYMCTWLSAMSALLLANILNVEHEVTMNVSRWAGWCVVCNSSLHVFVYFWRTPEYKRAILRFYGVSQDNEDGARIPPQMGKNNMMGVANLGIL